MLVRISLLGLLLTGVAMAQNNPREAKVRADKAKVEAEGFWLYNNLTKGYEVARETGKPLLVVLRCIPCEECVKLDDDLIDQDPVVRPLLDKFVCVRIVGTNGLDLSTFQYDTDQSFAVFMLNADKTVYGRFGTRSHHSDWVGDVSVAGMAKALQGALELHADYPANKAALAGKQGKTPLVASPELYPALKEKFTDKLNYEGNVVQSCIHCHQIGDAERAYYRTQGLPVPETVLFPYPHPKSVGLILDPAEKARVKEVVANSWADQAGFEPGDDMASLNGQPLLSMADVQWVLHQSSPDGAIVKGTVVRNGRTVPMSLELPAGWRRKGDIEWRVTSWGLRRMTLGGLTLKQLSDEARQPLKIPADQMALKVVGVGQYGPHGTAKKVGFQKEDIIIAYNGHNDLQRESDLFWHAMTATKPGDQVKVTVLRDGNRKELTLPMQE
ncbi:MAG: Trx7/PDZ domain-containing (seleno)protein [Planctomycetaceae bacterium]